MQEVKVMLSIMAICYLIQILQYKITTVETLFLAFVKEEKSFLIFVIQGRLKGAQRTLAVKNPCSKMQKATSDNGNSGANKLLVT